MTFDELYASQSVRVAKVVRKKLIGFADHVDDCTQQIWLGIWSSNQLFEKYSDHYIVEVAVNAALKMRKQIMKSRRPNPIQEHPVYQPVVAEGLSDPMRSAIRDLTPRQQQVITRVYLAESSIPAIAKELGITQDTVRWTLKQAKKALRTHPNLTVNRLAIVESE